MMYVGLLCILIMLVAIIGGALTMKNVIRMAIRQCKRRPELTKDDYISEELDAIKYFYPVAIAVSMFADTLVGRLAIIVIMTIVMCATTVFLSSYIYKKSRVEA